MLPGREVFGAFRVCSDSDGWCVLQGAPGPAAAPLDCSVAYAGGASKTYGHCQTLSPGEGSVRLYWTLDKAGSAIDGLLACGDGAAGWCAWGVPRTPGRMVGASVLVLRADPSSPTGAQA